MKKGIQKTDDGGRTTEDGESRKPGRSPRLCVSARESIRLRPKAALGPTVQNKANCPRVSGSGPGGKAGECPGWGAIMRNKANFHPCADREIGVPGAIVRNKPNLHPRRGIGGASRDPKRGLSRLGARSTLPAGTIAPNEPNSARPGGADRGAWGKRAKQTQFPERGERW